MAIKPFETQDGIVIRPGDDLVDENGQSLLGGAGGTSQLYLELTQSSIITQPITLGTPVTVTALAMGDGAFVEVVILPSEGPLLDSITVTSPGTGYVVGQRYRIWYWQVGGDNDADNIDFEVATVGSNGELLTVVNQVFEGTFTASNTPGTYSNTSIDYRPTEFDEVDTNLILTRGSYNGLFNAEAEFSYNSSESPTGTLWNADGWGTLLGLPTRTYETFDTVWNGNLTDLELIMWDTVNDKYYKFDFTVFGDSNGAYSYTRTLITDPNYFKKTDGLVEGEIDVIVEHPDLSLLEETYLEREEQFADIRDQDAILIAPETRPWDGLPSYQAYELIITYEVPDGVAPPSTNLVTNATVTRNAYITWREALAESVGITRGLEQGIYNPYQEDGWDSDVSPAGTLWNIDGWDDLTDIETRNYTNFHAAYGNGGLGNKVPGSKAIMYVEETDTYYAIDWISWTQGGDYGGFSYTRREIDLTKLDEGVRFADGTVQKTAYVPTDINVISTAPNDRRIETASGYKQVAVTSKQYSNSQEAVAEGSNAGNTWQVNVTKTEALTAIYNSETPVRLEVSVNETAWYPAYIGGISETAYQLVFENDVQLPLDTDDVIYYRSYTGGDSVVWWDKDDLPSGGGDFRGAIIDYHAYTSSNTIVGTIHIIDDDGDNFITHTEVSSADSSDGGYDNLWIVEDEGEIRYARVNGTAKTLRIHWTAKIFYGSDYSND